MNLFYLDANPQKNAEYHVDKHVVKMPLEAAQIICTTHWISRVIGTAPRPLDASELKVLRAAVITNECENIPYKPTHPNHPSVVWTRMHLSNFDWVLGYMYALGDEYTHRYGKHHLAVEKCSTIGYPLNIPTKGAVGVCSEKGWIPIINSTFALAMPDEYKTDDPIQSYRAYYKGAKSELAAWKNRGVPEWW